MSSECFKTDGFQGAAYLEKSRGNSFGGWTPLKAEFATPCPTVGETDPISFLELIRHYVG